MKTVRITFENYKYTIHFVVCVICCMCINSYALDNGQQLPSWQEIAESWDKDKGLPESASERAILGNALLASNKNNESLLVFSSLRKDEELKKWFDYTINLLEASPVDPRILYLAGDSHLRLGKYNEAIEYFDRCIDLDNSSSLPFLGRAIASYLLNKPKEEIIDTLNTASGKTPALSEIHNIMGIIHLQLGQEQEAIKAVQMGLEIDVASAACHLTLATAYQKAGKYDQALSEYDKAVVLCGLLIDICESGRVAVHERIARLYMIESSETSRSAGVTATVKPTIKMETFWSFLPWTKKNTAFFGDDLGDLGEYHEQPKVAQFEERRESKLINDRIVRFPDYSAVVTAIDQATSIAGGASKSVVQANIREASVSPPANPDAHNAFNSAIRLRTVEKNGKREFALFEYIGGAGRDQLHISNWKMLSKDKAIDTLNSKISYLQIDRRSDTSYEKLFQTVSGKEWHPSYSLAHQNSTKNYVPSLGRSITFSEAQNISRSKPNTDMKVLVGDTFTRTGTEINTTVSAFVNGRVPVTKIERVRNDAEAYTRQFRQMTNEIKTPDLSWLETNNNLNRVTPISSRINNTGALFHASSTPVNIRPSGLNTSPRGGVTLGNEPDLVAASEVTPDDILFGDDTENSIKLSSESVFTLLPNLTVIIY